MIRSALHRYTDLALTSLLRGVRLYEDGFGDRDSLMRLVDAVGHVAREDPLPGLELRWDDARTSGSTRERHGRFASPAVELPPESRDVHLLWLEPTQQVARPREVVVLLAATGEEGFFTRRRFAAPLVASGRAVLLVENPFYGARRPRGQRGPGLRTVRDQFAMNLATVLEGRAIVGWLASEGHPKIVLSGYSQGGIMAAFVSALVPFATGCVPRGSGARVEAIFTQGALSPARWTGSASRVSSAAVRRPRRTSSRASRPCASIDIPPRSRRTRASWSARDTTRSSRPRRPKRCTDTGPARSCDGTRPAT